MHFELRLDLAHYVKQFIAGLVKVDKLSFTVMAIAEEVDAQSTQSIGGYNETHEGKDSCVTHRKANTHFKDNK